MPNSVIPFPQPERSAEDDELVRNATQELLAAVTAQPVPERLQALAIELGRVLDQRQMMVVQDGGADSPQDGL